MAVALTINATREKKAESGEGAALDSAGEGRRGQFSPQDESVLLQFELAIAVDCGTADPDRPSIATASTR